MLLTTLHEALQLLQGNDDTKYGNVLRDSVIKRFEYSIDTFWKLIKEYIEVTQGVVVSGSPKMVAKTALDLKMITQEEYSFFLDMVDSRNLTSHTYNKVLAQEISNHIPGYYHMMKAIAGRLKDIYE